MVNVPTMTWREWTPSVDPSGYRVSTNPGDLSTAGYVKELGVAAGKAAVFSSLNISVSGQVSDTKMLTVYPSAWGDASGIFNMKFYMISTSAFTAGAYRFLYNIGTHWFEENQALNETDVDVSIVEPATTNLVSTLGSGVLSNTGFDDEDQVSQYVWIAVFVDTDVSVGTYGGAGNNSFRYRLKFDFS